MTTVSPLASHNLPAEHPHEPGYGLPSSTRDVGTVSLGSLIRLPVAAGMVGVSIRIVSALRWLAGPVAHCLGSKRREIFVVRGCQLSIEGRFVSPFDHRVPPSAVVANTNTAERNGADNLCPETDNAYGC